MADRKGSRGRLGAAACLACALLVLPLAACAQQPDAEQTLEQLTSVTEEPASPGDDDEFDATLHPDSIAEPLDCTPYLVVTARGTGEPPDKGQLLSPVARAISDSRPGQAEVLDLDYPAGGDVRLGSNAGARRLIDTLNLQAEHCPEQRFVLLGYSQGALIIGDVLVDPAERLVGERVGTLLAEAAERILAVVFYGNPRFVADEPFSVGGFSPQTNGILPRPQGSLSAFADRLRDYCEAADFICQRTLDIDPERHMAYYGNGMQHDGAAFVITRLDPLLPEPTAEAETG